MILPGYVEGDPMTRMFRLMQGQLRRDMLDDGCVTCGVTIPSALTWAHVHPDQGKVEQRVFRLCWTCHRLYDHGVFATAEVVGAENDWASGSRPATSPLFQRLAAEMTAGARVIRPELQPEDAAMRAGLAIRRRNRARKAAARRRNALAAAEQQVLQP